MPELTPLVPMAASVRALARGARSLDAAERKRGRGFGELRGGVGFTSGAGGIRGGPDPVPLWPGGPPSAWPSGGTAWRNSGLALLAGALLDARLGLRRAGGPGKPVHAGPRRSLPGPWCAYAANALTLYVAWGLLDLALLLLCSRTPGGRRVAVRATLVSPGRRGDSGGQPPGGLGPSRPGRHRTLGALLAFAAVCLATGALSPARDPGRRLGALPPRGADAARPVVVGAFLAKRLGAASGEPALAGWLTALAGVGLAAAAVLAWCQQGAGRWATSAMSGALVAFLAVAIMGRAGRRWCWAASLAVAAVLSVLAGGQAAGFRWAPWGARAFLAIGWEGWWGRRPRRGSPAAWRWGRSCSPAATGCCGAWRSFRALWRPWPGWSASGESSPWSAPGKGRRWRRRPRPPWRWWRWGVGPASRRWAWEGPPSRGDPPGAGGAASAGRGGLHGPGARVGQVLPAQGPARSRLWAWRRVRELSWA